MIHAEEWMMAMNAVRLYTRQREMSGPIDNARSRISQAEFAGDQEKLKHARNAYAEALAGLAPVLDEMVEVGMKPPPQPAVWIEDIRRFGLSKYPDSLNASTLPQPAEVDDGER